MSIIKDHKFRKKWGQNFLTDNNLLEKIVRTVAPNNQDSILEIGPGGGALSVKIINSVKEMVAVEVDPHLVQHLNLLNDLKRLKVVKGDILKKNIPDLDIQRPVRIIGNIPYNITSLIIFWLIDQRTHWKDAFIMMQKEVADRIVADVGTKDYGRLTVVIGAYLDTRYAFTIPPDVFVPKPKVNSAIICFTKKEKPLVADEQYIKFKKIVTAAFNQRRKMLRNSLKKHQITSEVKNKIDFSRRPETLSISEFAELV
tara:strand:- start:4130 stop:4897 length:768 start_codon:yes stop_codon:yes gene_type:complete